MAGGLFFIGRWEERHLFARRAHILTWRSSGPSPPEFSDSIPLISRRAGFNPERRSQRGFGARSARTTCWEGVASQSPIGLSIHASWGPPHT